MPPKLPSSRAPYLYASTSARLQRASRALSLQLAILTTSVRPARAALLLVPLYLHVYTPAARLQSSILLHSTFTHLYHASRVSYLYTSTCLYIPGPAACLTSSRSPYLYASSTSPGRNMPHEFLISMHLHLHVPKPTARLLSSRRPYIYASTSQGPQHASGARDLHTSFKATPAARV